MGGGLRACAACASSRSLSATLSYHPVMSGSGLTGRVSTGSCRGKGQPLAGFIISKRLTAS